MPEREPTQYTYNSIEPSEKTKEHFILLAKRKIQITFSHSNHFVAMKKKCQQWNTPFATHAAYYALSLWKIVQTFIDGCETYVAGLQFKSRLCAFEGLLKLAVFRVLSMWLKIKIRVCLDNARKSLFQLTLSTQTYLRLLSHEKLTFISHEPYLKCQQILTIDCQLYRMNEIQHIFMNYFFFPSILPFRKSYFVNLPTFTKIWTMLW